MEKIVEYAAQAANVEGVSLDGTLTYVEVVSELLEPITVSYPEMVANVTGIVVTHGLSYIDMCAHLFGV